MPACSTCTHIVPKRARTCPHCGFLTALTKPAKKQATPHPLPNMQAPPTFQQAPPITQRPPNIHQFQQQLHQSRRIYPQGGGVHPQPRGACPQIAASCYHHCPHYSFPPADKQSSSDVSALSVASLVLGVIALLSSCVPFLGLPFGIAGIVCGLACKDKKTKGTTMALVVTGIIFSVLGLLLSLAMLAFWLMTPSFEPFSADQFIF